MTFDEERQAEQMENTQINVVYKKGSTGKIVYDLHSQLTNDGYESAVYFVCEQLIKKN